MNLKKGLIISFGAHILLVFIMTIKAFFFAPQIIDISQAVRVDMVALPDKASEIELPNKVQDILKEKATPEPEPIQPEPETKKTEPIKETPEKDAIALKKSKPDLNLSKKKQKNALDKLKKLSAIDKIKQELENERKKQALIKGRVLSAGTRITGLDKIQSNEYLSQLDAQIKSSWSLPQWMIGKPFRATVWVQLNPDGTILSKKISSTSGNKVYDDYCLLAIDKASPFPPVPEKFTEVYKTDGVSFAFPD